MSATTMILELEQLQVSHTGSQDERRKHFDKAAIDELAESIKVVGLLSPIIARPVNGHFEIVAGERRFVAAKQAGLAEIEVSVRTLTDEQVLEIQLVENLQREGLHELAEAEGYEGLQNLGHSADEIADKVGKSKGYVYSRMKLLALGPAAREAFYRGELNASTALLLARIPVASVQRDATGKITKGRYDGAPLSFREARDLLEREYMLRLSDAPFPTGDCDLLAKAGACGPCPKRTGNQAELFSDIKSADVCTDPVCFKLKREAWSKVQIAQAKESGRKVITGEDAKKIAGHGWITNGYAKLDEVCNEDVKYRTFKQLLGKNREIVTLLQMPKTGDIVEVVNRAEAVKVLRKLGAIETRPGSSPKPRKDPVAKKADTAFLQLLFAAVHSKAPKKLSREILQSVVEHEMDAIGELPQMFFSAWGWDADTYEFDKLNETQLAQVLYEILVVSELASDPDIQIDQLSKVAKSLGIDVKKVKTDAAALTGPETAEPKAKKKAKAKK
jgi:ParB/RepB/Spo0J family partition protein